MLIEIIINFFVGVLFLYFAKGNEFTSESAFLNHFSTRVILMLIGGLLLGFALGDFLLWVRL